MCVSAARCFLSDVPFLVCSLKKHQTHTKNNYSAECRCISGVPLTAAVCRSPQTEASQSKSKQIIGNRRKSKQFASAVCRSHQRCAAYISGGPLKLWLRPLNLQASKEAIGLKRNDHDDLTPAVCHSAVWGAHQRCAIATIACTNGADISRNLMPLNRTISSRCQNADIAEPDMLHVEIDQQDWDRK